jgi:ferric-dicitrate binding protein FerR (iron transport regulator)
VIDVIPSLIDLVFLKSLTEKMQPFLISKMELGSASAADSNAKLLAEDPEMVAWRDELTERRKRLESVVAELKKYGY